MRIIEDTRAPFVTPPGLWLPGRDILGQPHGEGFEAAKKARTPRRSTRVTFRGLKFKRRYETLAFTEFRPLLALAFNPYVIDIREQFPIYKQEAYNRAVRAGRRMLEADKMTIDIVVTLVLPPDYRIHYHGISVKLAGAELSEKDEARHQREEEALGKLGWTWEFMPSNAYSALEFSNYLVMYRTIRDQDVFAQYEEADAFAEYVKKRSTNGTLGSVMRRIAKQMVVPEDRAHELFSIAVSYGMLGVDHTKPFRDDEALHVLR